MRSRAQIDALAARLRELGRVLERTTRAHYATYELFARVLDASERAAWRELVAVEREAAEAWIDAAHETLRSALDDAAQAEVAAAIDELRALCAQAPALLGARSHVDAISTARSLLGVELSAAGDLLLLESTCSVHLD